MKYQILMPDMLSATPNVGAGPQGETSQARQPFACDKVTFFRCHVQFEDVSF